MNFITPFRDAVLHMISTRLYHTIKCAYRPIKSPRSVPPQISQPQYAFDKGGVPAIPESILLKDLEDIDVMRVSCELAKSVLEFVGTHVKPGITTAQLDKLTFDRIIQSDAYPSPLKYMGFPASICASVNNIMVHGIPDDRVLLEGDILNIDVTVYFNSLC